MTHKDLQVLAHWLASGAALGGGTMMAAKLLHYLNESDPDKLKEEDDDTLYVYKKANGDNDSEDDGDGTMGYALGVPGSIATALGTAWLVNQLYNKMRKDEAQKELDEAQRMFIRASGMTPVDEFKKKASNDLASGEVSNFAKLKGSMIALPLLVALTTGIVSNAILESQFPLEKKKPSPPRRIELIDEEDAKRMQAVEKLASAVDDNAKELLIRTLHLTKSASCDISNLVAAIAENGAEVFEKTAAAAGFFGALDCVKGAIDNAEYSDEAAHITVAYLTKNAAYGPAIELTAALDYADMYPSMFHTCRNLPLETQLGLCKIASILGAGIRQGISEELQLTNLSEDSLCKKAASIIFPTAIASAIQDLKDLRESLKDENITDEEKKETQTKIITASRELQKTIESIDDETLKKMLSVS